MYEKLFTPGKIGNITVKNRLVMSPMGIGLAELDGSPSEDMLAFYEARAMGGAGLIIPEITRVNDVHGAGLIRCVSKIVLLCLVQSLGPIQEQQLKEYMHIG